MEADREKAWSHSLTLSPWYRINSRWILSTPGTLFALRHFRAVLISLVVKSPERPRSVLGDSRDLSLK